MTAEPQFEHKNPGFCEELPGSESALRRRPTNLYNAAVIASTCGAWTFEAWGNDVLGFGLMALPDRGAAADGGPGRIRIRQMGIPQ
jgi:hypothetical protein